MQPSSAVDGSWVLRKTAWRLVPFLCLLYVLNILDRGNVGFARLTMQKNLKLSQAVFDLGYGIFYVGYLAFEVPANLLLLRFGARLWIARIMISWGFVSAATMLVTGPVGFYGVRILLGVAEAGFFPGIILYLTYWFPARERARVVAWFMTAIALSGIFGNSLSGAIMYGMDGTAGLEGWQWLFLLEGIPSVVVGIVVLFYLPDGPAQATWLSPTECAWLEGELAREERERRERHGPDRLAALLDWRVWLLIVVYFTVAVGANAAGAHNPTLLKQHFPECDTRQIGLLSALPHLCAVLAMTVIGTHSDRTGERRWHTAYAATLAASGWALAAVTYEPALFLLGLCVAQAGMMSFLPVFWTLPTSFLSGTIAAGGIALINSLANIGGIVGPSILSRYGLESMALNLFVGGLLILLMSKETVQRKPST